VPIADETSPVVLEGTLEGSLSRWLWLIKQLTDAGAALHEGVDDFVHGASPERSAQVTSVLVQETVRQEHHPAASLIPKTCLQTTGTTPSGGRDALHLEHIDSVVPLDAPEKGRKPSRLLGMPQSVSCDSTSAISSAPEAPRPDGRSHTRSTR